MTKTKSTKRALLMSALSLLMCVSMLIGSTFAWFTDSVTSGNNIIKSGNLDVELEYYKNGKWATVNNATDLFTGNLWEPGHAEVVYLKLSNLGSLALKYQLGINIVSETEGTNVAGDTFKLSDYIYMGVVEDVNGQTAAYATREAAIAATNGTGIISTGYTKNGTMTAGQDALYLALVVYMPETVGNEANYKTDTKAPEINLGVNLIATQLTKEEDSFGNDYDKNAGLYNIVVTSEDELVAALANAKNGDIIGISGNVTWTTGAPVDSTPFVTNATYITLQGVDEDATFTATGSGVGPVGIDNGTVIFKNLKIADNSVSYAENSWEYGYLEFRGNTVFENCDIVNAIMMEGDSATFKNCSFNSNKDSEYAVWVYSGDATFENCTFTGARGVKVHEAYGTEVGTVVIDGCVFNGLTQKPGVAIDTATANITIKNSTFINCQAGDQGKYIYETDNAVPTLENNTVLNDVTVVSTADELAAALEDGETAVLVDDITYHNADPDKQLILESENDINFNGNGNTITVTGSDPSVGNHGYVGFVLTDDEKSATVSNLTVTGTGFVELGDYNVTGGTYVANNLVIENLVSTLANVNGSDIVGCAFMQYGTGTLNNCVMTGTTALIDGTKPYDAGFGNTTTTTINGGEYGVIRVWEQAHVTINGAEIGTIDSRAITTRNLGMLTIGAGTHVGTINLIPGSYPPALTIVEGATVDAIVYNGVTYTQAEWLAR